MCTGNSVFPLPATGGGPSVADYGHGLEEWQRDYEQSVKAITGQTIAVPLFIQQYSHWNNVPNATSASTSPRRTRA